MRTFVWYVVGALAGILMYARISSSTTPASALLGVWQYHHATGSPCRELIDHVRYFFSEDGQYEAHAKMRRLGGIQEERAKGAYVATATTITTTVNGYKIGPLHYRFEKTYLVFEQQNPRCDIFLTRED